MKKSILILILLAGISLNAEAQHFIASFGVQHTWGVPRHVSSIITSDYYGYEWVHTSRVHRSGNVFFDLVLQRGDMFIEVSVRNDGYISRRVRREYYPLNEHVCSNYCGYHSNYYKTYYQDCHNHHHQGHNHVVVYKNHPNGHAYGHHKNKHFKKYSKEHSHHADHSVYVYSNDKYKRVKSDEKEHYNRDSRERRDRYHDTKEHRRGRGNDKYDKERGGNRHYNSRGASFVHRTK